MTQKMIRQLLAVPRLRVECPHCDEASLVKRAKLFSMYDSYPSTAQEIMRKRLADAREHKKDMKERKRQLAESRKKKPQQIATAAQASNFGQISEQILPAFLTFPYKQSECRILFKPVDYIVFEGLSGRKRVEAIRFVDVKTGNGRLTSGQRQIRDRVTEGKIKHRTIGR